VLLFNKLIVILTQGLQIVPNAKQMDSQLIGRVLFDTVIDVETGRIIGYKNQDISPALALKLVKQTNFNNSFAFNV